ncbi:MAG: sodium-dependent transporter [Simkaniaceae bacterium]|nr:sodium-dependent transporter [Simkaniaceae bacterium]
MTQLREHWSSKLGFIMAAIGSAIGLGILWKFPYTVGQNGGGLFLLMYLVCVLLVGLPLFVAELVMGRGAQRASVGAFDVLYKVGSAWRLSGVLGALASFLIMSFYSVIAGWGMSYILMSLVGFYQGLGQDEIGEVFYRLSHSGEISLFWHLCFTLVTMGVVYSGVRKGIEYWSNIMVRIFLVLMVGLFLFAMTLDGFHEAARFIFTPDSSKFTVSGAIEALGLAFWTLSIGQGIMISYGSYMRSDQNIVKMAGIVGGSVLAVACLSSLMIFPVVFTFGLEPSAGSGLVFQTLPYLFAKLPGSMVISTVFFSLFVFTALTSSIPLVEVPATNLMELYGISRNKAVTIVGAGTFLVGIPSAYSASGGVFPFWGEIYGMNFLDTVNQVVSTWIIPVGGLLLALFVGWVMPREVAFTEFMKGQKGTWFFKPWFFFMRYVVPLTIIIIILQTSGLIDFDRIFG